MSKNVAIFRGTLIETDTQLVQVYDLSPSYKYSVGKDHRSVSHVAVSQVTVGTGRNTIVIKLDSGSLRLLEENFVEDTATDDVSPKELLEKLGYTVK